MKSATPAVTVISFVITIFNACITVIRVGGGIEGREVWRGQRGREGGQNRGEKRAGNEREKGRREGRE